MFRTALLILVTFSFKATANNYSAADFAAVPPLLQGGVDPFTMINLSVELTQQAEAYTDGYQTLVGGTHCPGRTNADLNGDGDTSDPGDVNNAGFCYSQNETYIGYFNPKLCYKYNTSYANTGIYQSAYGPDNSAKPHFFDPVGYTNAKHRCVNENKNYFSGNFMNWATMTALDEFRYAMTGGARLIDEAGAGAVTMLTRTHRYGDWGFVNKAISTYGISRNGYTFTNKPKHVTPFNSAKSLYIYNGGNFANGVNFYDENDNSLGFYNVIVRVCDGVYDVDEERCTPYYGNAGQVWYKPEGAMQRNAMSMRFALTSYTARDGNNISGGVLRANAKYIGYMRPLTTGGVEINPNAEINESGQYVYDPDKLIDIGRGVKNSGILNYINMFGLTYNRYKSNDPVGELYYEGLRYIMGWGPTPEYSAGLSNNERDNFPVITDWEDPVLHSCQANYMVAIGDQFAWDDNDLPGVATGGATAPSDPLPINVGALTNRVGTLENFYPGTLGTRTRGRNNNGWYVAGLAYYAATQDIRPDSDADLGFDDDQHVKTFFVDTQEYNGNPPMRENNPLWMAAKYGGFEEDDDPTDPNFGDPNDGDPNVSNPEWDEDGDGDPDTYILASQPANLVEGLSKAFNEIAGNINAGSSAGVVSNTAAGQGLIVQGLYKPSHSEGSKTVKWGGMLHSLFIDEHGNVREDTNSDGRITNADTVIRFVSNIDEQKSTASRYTTSDGGKTVSLTPTATGVEIDDLDKVWDAREQLASLNNVTSQRAYSSAFAPNSGRYIITGVDKADGEGVRDGIIVADEVIPFTDANFPDPASSTSDNFRLLGLDSGTASEAPDIINYVRGDDTISGYRSRTVDYDKDGVEEVWRLGDIVSSSPAVVSEPPSRQRYDLIYDDETFLAFMDKYRDRRHVVYTGANDGMLHAFNAGFYDRDAQGYTTTGPSGETKHPLGSELWAYVPYNVLPHLRWLKDTSYPHVYYVDGIPQVFHANLGSDTGTVGSGWSTLLVVGMRFGGGEITLDPDSDKDSDLDDDITMRSAYIVLDITNPEEEPKLIAEITHPLMGYTTSRPTVIKARSKSGTTGGYKNTTNDKWYLVMGSGPYGDSDVTRDTALSDAVSSQQAKIFVFDLVKKEFVLFDDQDYIDVPDAEQGFAGDFISVDWDSDFTDDAVYFGTVTGSIAEPSGSLMRIELGDTETTFLTGIDSKITHVLEKNGSPIDQPVSGMPFAKNYKGDNWVFVGSGRYYVSEDGLSEAQNSGYWGYYGIKEPMDDAGELTFETVDIGQSAVDVTDLLVQYINHGKGSDAIVYDTDGSTPVTLTRGSASADVGNFVQLKQFIADGDGWYLDFRPSHKARNVGRTVGTSDWLLYTEYDPSGEACNPLGYTYISALHFQTGTAPFFSTINKQVTTTKGPDALHRHVDTSYYGFIRELPPEGPFIPQDQFGGMGEPIQPNVLQGSYRRVSWREINITW